MSGVKEKTVPIENEDGQELSDALVALVRDQQKEIESTGVTVTKVVIREGGGPPRFNIVFNGPSADTRYLLEKEHYDVGQNLSGKNLSFYVTKRVEKTKGWSV